MEFMVMNVYLLLKFSSGSKDFKREGERLKNKSNFKAMMILRFDMRGIGHMDWVSEGQTINEVYYKEVLTILHERVRKEKPEMWKKGSWILHHDNAPAHNGLSRRFWHSTRSPCWNIHPTHLT
jgi:hypothetical protein